MFKCFNEILHKSFYVLSKLFRKSTIFHSNKRIKDRLLRSSYKNSAGLLEMH